MLDWICSAKECASVIFNVFLLFAEKYNDMCCVFCSSTPWRVGGIWQSWCSGPLKGPSDKFLFFGRPRLVRTREKRGQSIKAFSVAMEMQEWVHFAFLPTYRILLTEFFFLWRCDPTRVMASSFLRFLDHTQRRTTVDRTPLDEWSARRRDLYLTTHNTNNRQTSMPPVGFEPTISAGERPQTYALDRVATGTGIAYWCITM